MFIRKAVYSAVMAVGGASKSAAGMSQAYVQVTAFDYSLFLGSTITCQALQSQKGKDIN